MCKLTDGWHVDLLHCIVIKEQNFTWLKWKFSDERFHFECRVRKLCGQWTCRVSNNTWSVIKFIKSSLKWIWLTVYQVQKDIARYKKCSVKIGERYLMNKVFVCLRYILHSICININKRIGKCGIFYLVRLVWNWGLSCQTEHWGRKVRCDAPLR